jgi:SPP1 gp7 family putative phage head morphogenesis protein
MQYVEQRKLNRDQILSIFKVPKSILAVSDNVNKATAEAENIAFAKVVIKPRLELIFDKLNRFLLPLFEGTEGMEFRFENPITEDKEFTLKEKSASVNVWRTINEIRQDEGLDPVEGGDELPLTTLITNSDEQSPTPNSEKDDEEEEEKGIEHKHKTKELLPDPKDVKGKKNKEYIKRRNAYIKYKETQYSLALLQHFNFLIADIRKAPIKKELEDPAEQFEYTDEQVFEKIMPDKEKRKQWEMLLLLLVLQNNTQIFKTNLKQLNEVYGLDIQMNDLTENFISRRAVFTAKSVNDTVYKTIKKVINDDVKNGITDIGQIKKDIGFLLKDAKAWKVEQIAQTEMAWAYGEASYKTYKENGIEQVQWLCGSDPCEVCATNCGEIVKLNAMFSSGHIHEPVHPNCRCSVLPVV